MASKRTTSSLRVLRSLDWHASLPFLVSLYGFYRGNPFPNGRKEYRNASHGLPAPNKNSSSAHLTPKM